MPAWMDNCIIMYAMEKDRVRLTTNCVESYADVSFLDIRIVQSGFFRGTTGRRTLSEPLVQGLPSHAAAEMHRHLVFGLLVFVKSLGMGGNVMGYLLFVVKVGEKDRRAIVRRK